MADPLDVAFECVWVARPGVPSLYQRNGLHQAHGIPLLLDQVHLDCVPVEVDFQLWQNSQDRIHSFLQFVYHVQLNYVEVLSLIHI